MKKRTFKRLAVITAALALVSTTAVAGTMAKYVSTGTDDVTYTVAKWSVTAAELESTINETKHVAVTSTTGKIAPGSTGVIEIDVTNASEVCAKIEATATLPDSVPEGFTLTIVTDELELAHTGTPECDHTNTSGTLKWTWAWAYDSTGTEGAYDSDHTTNWGNNQTIEISIDWTATQIAPEAA